MPGCLKYFRKKKSSGVAGVLNDPYWSNVVLMMHMNQGFSGDSKGSVYQNKGAQLGAIGPFGDGAAWFNGSGNILMQYTPLFTGGDATIECWAYYMGGTSYGNFNGLINNSNGINLYSLGWDFGRDASGRLVFRNSGGMAISSTNPSVPMNQWTHLAFSYKASTGMGYLFVDGVMVGSGAIAVSESPSYQLNLGSGYGCNFQGYIDEVRITKGVARYLANFNRPVAVFPDK